MQAGFFIVFEGIDGSGKTTQAKAITKWLNSRNIRTFATSEPTKGTEIGKLLRKQLRTPNSIPSVDALLFAADRVSHYHDKIEQKIQAGINVICDRYVYSSIVYQSHQNLSPKWLWTINENAPPPSLIIYIDILPENALERISEENRKIIEKFESLQILHQIDASYKKVLKPFKHEIVDGNKSQIEVTKQIGEKILKTLF